MFRDINVNTLCFVIVHAATLPTDLVLILSRSLFILKLPSVLHLFNQHLINIYSALYSQTHIYFPGICLCKIIVFNYNNGFVYDLVSFHKVIVLSTSMPGIYDRHLLEYARL